MYIPLILLWENEARVLKCTKGRVQKVSEKPYRIPEHGKKKMSLRPVVVGSGPAGLFCAYLLALEGYRPLIVERGGSGAGAKGGCRTFLGNRSA